MTIVIAVALPMDSAQDHCQPGNKKEMQLGNKSAARSSQHGKRGQGAKHRLCDCSIEGVSSWCQLWRIQYNHIPRLPIRYRSFHEVLDVALHKLNVHAIELRISAAQAQRRLFARVGQDNANRSAKGGKVNPYGTSLFMSPTTGVHGSDARCASQGSTDGETSAVAAHVQHPLALAERCKCRSVFPLRAQTLLLSRGEPKAPLAHTVPRERRQGPQKHRAVGSPSAEDGCLPRVANAGLADTHKPRSTANGMCTIAPHLICIEASLLATEIGVVSHPPLYDLD